jgi:GMP synthase-like glutamine amidotransferase
MLKTEKQQVKIAILDLYKGYPNQGMQALQDIINAYALENQINTEVKVYDVRNKNEIPNTGYDIYISSGGPGSPLRDSNSTWEKKYFDLFAQLETHNNSTDLNKKHAFFICHSFQLMCRKYKLGKITERKAAVFGIFDIHTQTTANNEPIFSGLPDPFFAVDSRSWQVTEPDIESFEKLGAEILALENPQEDSDERCLMAIRFNPYFFGTQFHPEANPIGLKNLLLTAEKKTQVINDHGVKKYLNMLQSLDNPNMISLTQHTIIPNFLDLALNKHPVNI